MTYNAHAGETGSLRRTAALLILASAILTTPVSLYAQYGGPSLLSRGGNSPGKRGRAPVSITPYAAIRGIYETGLLQARLDQAGNLQPLTRKGAQVELGAYGSKSWRRTSFGVDYRGDYRRYFGGTELSGTNQALSLDTQSQISRRFSTFGRFEGGTTNRAFGGFSAPAFGTGQNFGVPLNELFDNRVYFAQLGGGVGYRASARTIYRFSGDGFLSKRTGGTLISMQGYRAGVDVQRVMSRNTTIGGGYNFIHFEYPHIYGASDIHMTFVSLQRSITRNFSVQLQGGLFFADTVGTQTITLSPEVAAVLGRSQGVEAFQRNATAPQVTASVSYTLERSRLNATYERSITPGNGIYITSKTEQASGGYSYSGLRRLSLGVSAGWSRQNSLGLELRNFSSIQGGGGATYKLARYFSLSLQADRRKYTSPGFNARNGTFISFGLSFSPSSLPISIW